MSHPNALLTRAGREPLVSRVLKGGWTVTDAGSAAGVSRQTAHQWIGRHLAGGRDGLRDRSSRPASVRPRVSARDIRRIWRRRRLGEGPLQISWHTGIPASAVYAVLARNGQGRLGEGGDWHSAGAGTRSGRAASAGTSCTWPLMITPASPTSRSIPMSGARPWRVSLRGARRHDQARDHRERLEALPGWIFNCNHRRPHGGIGGLPPVSRVPGVNNVSGQYT